ncbi:MAG: GNAT family N-acetyltransferase [Defluviitaleaceae bacterium]|nr:GNAT family N-acetyltransferase [Defluviitaleaceae bacterium]MCL2275700.1 GNAT family N-acetyltransferase [Defluviitaleaceae bacterium]
MLSPYRKKDFNACVNLFIAAFSAPPLSYDFLTEEKVRRYLRDLINTPGFAGYIYEFEGEAAAFCFGKTEDYFHAPQYVVNELAVHPNLHGKGVGRAAMQAVEAELAKTGYVAVALETSKIIPAYYFYRKLGYENISDNVSLTKPL